MQENRTRYLVKNTSIFAIGNIATKLINFFLVPLYTNVLSTSEYGTVDLVNTICTVLAPILILNISESVMRFALDKDANHKTILSNGVAILVIGIIAGLLIIPVCCLFQSINEFSLYIYFYSVSASVCSVFVCYLRGKEKLATYTVSNVIHTASIAGFNVLFLLVLRQGVTGYFKAYILAAMVTATFSFFAGKAYKDLFPFCFDCELAKKMMKFSVVLIPNTFMWWIMNSSDRLMVTAMVGASANGIYAVSYKLPTLVSTITSIFIHAWSYSAIKEKGSQDEQQFNNRILKMLTSISMLIGIGIISLGKPFLRVYVTREYFEAWKYIPFLTIGFVYMTLGSFFATSYTVHKDSFGYLFSGTFGAVFNVALNFLLIPMIGLYGAATATCVSYIMVCIFRYFHTKKYLKYDILNHEFIVGSALMISSAIIMFMNGILWSVLQIVILLIALIYYSKTWVPYGKTILKRLKGNENAG